jgi:DNA-binding transcriptional ArsR family regulator
MLPDRGPADCKEIFAKLFLRLYARPMAKRPAFAPPADKVHPTPTALKAMAHPIRMQLIGLLRSDGPATATQLARRLQLSSGATSYHLRQLAAFGFVDDMPDEGNRRERWWQAAHRSTWTKDVTDNAGEQAALDAYIETVAHMHIRQLETAMAERSDWPRAWADAGTISDWQLRLTAAQTKELQGKLTAVLEGYRAVDPSPEAAPLDAELVVIQLHAFLRPQAPGDAPRSEGLGADLPVSQHTPREGNAS